MRKIKYQGGLTKLITSKIGYRNKMRFASFIESECASFLHSISGQVYPYDVVSFSSGKDFYDQILSILSFVRHLGVPNMWTIYSDGTHSKKQVQLLQQRFDFVVLEQFEWDTAETLPATCKASLLPYSNILFHYAKHKPLGRKNFYYLNHKIQNPTLFIDADILFYEKARLLNFIFDENVNGWYLPDPCWGCLDSRYKAGNKEQLYQLNGGMLLINKELSNIEEGMAFLESIKREYEYFTDQTVFHILARSNNFMPLDPRLFIVDAEDQFDFSYLYPRNKMAIRHYTGPVRHKMWQRDWTWQLSLS